VKLKSKVILFFLALALLSGSLIMGLAWKAINAVETKSLKETAQARVKNLADEQERNFERKSETELLPALQMVQRLSNAEYVAALDANGMIMAHTNVGEKGKLYRNMLLQGKLNGDRSGADILKIEKEFFLEAWAPVWKHIEESNEGFLLGDTAEHLHTQRLGTVVLRQSIQPMLQTQKQIIQQMGLIVGAIGTIAFLFTLGLMRKILIPIRQLAEGTARIAQGDYTANVPASSSDELGDLARSFNAMSKVLSDTTVSKDYLSGVLANLVDPLIILSPDAILRDVNPATLELLGSERDDLIGKPLEVICREEASSLRTPENKQQLRESILRNIEVNFFTKKGESIPVLLSSAVLKDPSGHVTSIILTVKDMTERKRLEGIIRQSDKMSAVGQLAAGVAHEINNPLGVILGFAQAALRRVKAGEVLEMPLKSIEKEALRCKELVQDLLTFSRISKVEREPMDLNKTIEGALSLISAQARMSRVEVRKELSKDLPRLLGNPNQIQQIIVNLANNALDAMGDQGVLTVRTENLRDGPLSWICLRIIDSGPGIPSEIVSRIFEPFFTTKPVGKGTGLGLSLIHEIVKKHSGTIDVKSQPGCTEFCVKFPVRLSQGNFLQTPMAPRL
jgi:PAS domain S-box-containing protein